MGTPPIYRREAVWSSKVEQQGAIARGWVKMLAKSDSIHVTCRVSDTIRSHPVLKLGAWGFCILGTIYNPNYPKAHQMSRLHELVDKRNLGKWLFLHRVSNFHHCWVGFVLKFDFHEINFTQM